MIMLLVVVFLLKQVLLLLNVISLNPLQLPLVLLILLMLVHHIIKRVASIIKKIQVEPSKATTYVNENRNKKVVLELF